MQNQPKKTIEEKRQEAQRALEWEERGKKRKEIEKRIAEKKLREKENIEKKTREENEKRKLEEKQKKDLLERKLKEEERQKKQTAIKDEEERKLEERKSKQKEEEERNNREALLMQIRPPGKKLRPLSKEVKTQKKNTVSVPHIKTYRNDAVKAIKKQGESLTKIVLAEKKKKEEKTLPMKVTPSVETPKTRPASTSNKINNKIIIIITGLIIVGISGGALVYLYQNNKKKGALATPEVTKTKTSVVTVTPAVAPSLVTANTEKNINISIGSTAVLNTIAKELKETVGTGSIKNIYLTESATVFTKKGASETQQISGIKKLLSVWSNKMPALLSRSLSNEFMLGVYSSNPGRNMPFLVLTTNSYEQTFAGMFKWENNILSDFYKLFGLSIKQTTQPFHDYVIRGNDVRILKNQDGETLALYSFISKNKLVITTNEEVLNKILFRLK